jgi:uncharacterized membrane protein
MPNETATTFDVNRYGSFTANFKHIPPPVPPEYWVTLFTIVATALVGSLLVPAIIGWFTSKRQTSRLNSYYRDIDRYGKSGERNADRLNALNNKIINAYSQGKLNNEQYTNLRTEISILFYEEIYNSLFWKNHNAILLDEAKDNIKDAYAKGKIIELHYKLLIEKISDSTNHQ